MEQVVAQHRAESLYLPHRPSVGRSSTVAWEALRLVSHARLGLIRGLTRFKVYRLGARGLCTKYIYGVMPVGVSGRRTIGAPARLLKGR